MKINYKVEEIIKKENSRSLRKFIFGGDKIYEENMEVINSRYSIN